LKNYCPSFRLWNSFSIFNTINKISKNIRTKDRFIKINFNKINKILLAKKALVFSKPKFKVTFLHKTIFNKSLGKKDSKEAKRIAYFTFFLNLRRCKGSAAQHHISSVSGVHIVIM